MTNLLLILAALALVLLNGFFVAAEFAIVKLRATHVATIKAVYGLRGQVLAQIHRRLDAYLSACQLGITLASLGLGWIGEPAFAELLTPLLHTLKISSVTTVEVIAFLVAFFLISFLHIVMGELAPKSIAIRKAEATSLWTAIPLYSFYWVMYPIIWLLNTSANLILSLLGISLMHETESRYSPEEIRLILKSSHLHDRFATEERTMLKQVASFAERKVVDLMRPVDEMVALNLRMPLSENLRLITQHRFSRYPVFEDNINQIKGLVHVKDLFALSNEKKPLTSLATVMRPILNVPVELLALELLRRFRSGQGHFAVVHSDRGAIVGFITLDNILGMILGKIRDEFHLTHMDWLLQKRGTLLVKGDTPLYVLETALGIEAIAAPDEVNTISGLIMAKLDRLPQPREKIAFTEFDAVVRKMKGPRILQVEIISTKVQQDEAADKQ